MLCMLKYIQVPEAGDAFTKAADLFKKTPDTNYEASKALENAAKCFKKSNPEGKPSNTVCVLSGS